MPIITYWNTTRDQTGQTLSAVATATNMAIQQNVKILLISTSLNDDTMKNCFWHEKKGMLSGIFGASTNLVNQSGIEGLDRIARSNKISSDIIKDYTKAVFKKNRLELLLGITGTKEQYEAIVKQYPEIITLASDFYDYVFVDLDKRIDYGIQKEILKKSDVIVPIISQNPQKIQETIGYFKKVPDVDINKAILTLGRYNSRVKYNAKNISRNMLNSRDIINTVPFNNLLYEASIDGTITDFFYNISKSKGRDENTEFSAELNRLLQDIKYRISISQNRK